MSVWHVWLNNGPDAVPAFCSVLIPSLATLRLTSGLRLRLHQTHSFHQFILLSMVFKTHFKTDTLLKIKYIVSDVYRPDTTTPVDWA